MAPFHFDVRRMFLGVGLMEATGGMGGTWCWFAIPRGVTWGL
jgi:hypothetical protein